MGRFTGYHPTARTVLNASDSRRKLLLFILNKEKKNLNLILLYLDEM